MAWRVFKRLFKVLVIEAPTADRVGKVHVHDTPRRQDRFLVGILEVTEYLGDLLDTAEGRSKFCRLNESGLFNKDDPAYPGYKIWVFNNKGEGMVVKRRSRVDPSLMENVEFNAEGHEISRSFEPA